VLRRRGYGGTGVAEVTAEAAVSKATFYRNFDGLPSCILATFGAATQSVLVVVEESCEGNPGAEPALSDVLGFLEAEPALAHVLTNSALDDVPGVAAARGEFIARCASLLASASGGSGDRSRERRARHLLRGVQGWLSTRLAAGEVVGRPRELVRLLTL
ncbi:MAG TPA: TetR family transcriptional regulator, partial [Solirubrobacterales bacterium]|nr:TetR family transcriptional regulator [Solirubrobacterales bacterium]